MMIIITFTAVHINTSRGRIRSRRGENTTGRIQFPRYARCFTKLPGYIYRYNISLPLFARGAAYVTTRTEIRKISHECPRRAGSAGELTFANLLIEANLFARGLPPPTRLSPRACNAFPSSGVQLSLRARRFFVVLLSSLCRLRHSRARPGAYFLLFRDTFERARLRTRLASIMRDVYPANVGWAAEGRSASRFLAGKGRSPLSFSEYDKRKEEEKKKGRARASCLLTGDVSSCDSFPILRTGRI